ncbi:hypothetical protein GBA63_12710 [Rubrobacter tropicus]|uniref:YtxH domain-containing protein n=1 Tax=Rubrobacter tropicus TaxID=2653851 RepID=A0A6G8QA91_9ACTN|nr:hypothetical protein [Rubrobacter tropicus]QIN83400.1 hypothetical protein GBA63_12710 [Rubrobacter tropicus]
MGEGTTKFFLGASIGAACGFAAGAFAATPTARSAGQSAVGGVGTSFRFLGRGAIRTAKSLGPILEFGYTRVRGREKYLEHEIEQLRTQITRLEQKID